MSTVSKHIFNEIADKLIKKKDNSQIRIQKLEAMSQEELSELAAFVNWYENLENINNITTAEKEKLTENEVYSEYAKYIESQQ